MKKRFKMSRGNSNRKWKKTAGKTHRKNIGVRPMRGGTRL